MEKDDARLMSKLHADVQEWLRMKMSGSPSGWTHLFEIQRQAINHFHGEYAETKDAIISAPTAGGKTMAVFLPLLDLARKAVDAGKKNGEFNASFSILYISPLIALLKQMSAEHHDIMTLHHDINLKAVTWHGERSSKMKLREANPEGLEQKDGFGAFLTTPESLESLLINRPELVKARFAGLRFVVIDELHDYFDTARGRQLISLLARLDNHLEGKAPRRIALSATLGDRYSGGKIDHKKLSIARRRVGSFLRPSLGLGKSGFKRDKIAEISDDRKALEGRDEAELGAEAKFQISLVVMPSRRGVAEHLASLTQSIKKVTGVDDKSVPRTSALIFANSKHDVEHYAEALSANADPPMEGVMTELPESWFASVENNVKVFERAWTFLENQKQTNELVGTKKDYAGYRRLHVLISDFISERVGGDGAATEAKKSPVAYPARILKELERILSPNLIWPHHASLPASARNHAELRMREVAPAAAVICTTTLELGIDVGPVDDVTQIDPAPSVTSLRQRLGRSRRRAYAEPGIEPPKLNIVLHEAPLTGGDLEEGADPIACLRLKTFQSVAQTILLRERAYESPRTARLDISTLVQQVLNLMNQKVTERAIAEKRKKQDETAEFLQTVAVDLEAVARILCEEGPFGPSQISDGPNRRHVLYEVLEALSSAAKPRLCFKNDRIWLTEEGRRWKARPDIYSAFLAAREVSILAGGLRIGTISTRRGISVGETILIAGQAWRVMSRDVRGGALHVSRVGSGRAQHFQGSLIPTSGTLIQRMKELYFKKSFKALLTEVERNITELTEEAKARLEEGWRAAKPLRERDDGVLELKNGNGTYYLPWRGRRHIEGMRAALQGCHVPSVDAGIAVFVPKLTHEQIQALVSARWDRFARLDQGERLRRLINARQGKFDSEVPASFWRRDFASSEVSYETVEEIFGVRSLSHKPVTTAPAV